MYTKIERTNSSTFYRLSDLMIHFILPRLLSPLRNCFYNNHGIISTITHVSKKKYEDYLFSYYNKRK